MEADGDRHAVHFRRRRVFTSPLGSSVNPTVPPFICTVDAVARIDVVVDATGIMPPFKRSQSYTGFVEGIDREKRVMIDMFLVTPMWPPVGVSDVQKYPTWLVWSLRGPVALDPVSKSDTTRRVWDMASRYDIRASGCKTPALVLRSFVPQRPLKPRMIRLFSVAGWNMFIRFPAANNSNTLSPLYICSFRR